MLYKLPLKNHGKICHLCILTITALSPVFVILYLDHGNSLPAGLLASSLAFLQNSLHTLVKGNELSKTQIAYGFTLLKNTLWLSRQMNLITSLSTFPALSPILSSLMLMLADVTYTFSLLNTSFYFICLFLKFNLIFLSSFRYYKQFFFKKNKLGTLCIEHTILFCKFVSWLCYSSV